MSISVQRAASIAAVAVAALGCGRGDDPAVSTSATVQEATSVTTGAPTTSVIPTTSAVPTSIAPTTSVAPTTSLVPIPGIPGQYFPEGFAGVSRLFPTDPAVMCQRVAAAYSDNGGRVHACEPHTAGEVQAWRTTNGGPDGYGQGPKPEWAGPDEPDTIVTVAVIEGDRHIGPMKVPPPVPGEPTTTWTPDRFGRFVIWPDGRFMMSASASQLIAAVPE